MSTPFRMKGSPFQRNFGIGSPLRQAIGGGAGEALAHHKEYMADKAALKGAKKVIKKTVGGNIAKVASRALGAVGVGATLYDFYKSGQKHSGGKAGDPSAKSAFSGGKTWSESKEAGKSDIWGKNK